MEPIDTQALNKKLAGWARPQHKLQSTGDSWGNQRCIYCGGLDAIAYPIKEQCIPNFTESLDVCFKWLVPKLQDKGNNVELYAYEHKGYQATVYKDCFSQRGSDGFDPWLESISQVRDDDPALALCLAIEKLIDEKDSASS